MKKELDYHAKLVVYGIQDMRKPAVKRLAAWLRTMADDFELSPKEYSNRFTAQLMK